MDQDGMSYPVGQVKAHVLLLAIGHQLCKMPQVSDWCAIELEELYVTVVLIPQCSLAS